MSSKVKRKTEDETVDEEEIEAPSKKYYRYLRKNRWWSDFELCIRLKQAQSPPVGVGVDEEDEEDEEEGDDDDDKGGDYYEGEGDEDDDEIDEGTNTHNFIGFVVKTPFPLIVDELKFLQEDGAGATGSGRRTRGVRVDYTKVDDLDDDEDEDDVEEIEPTSHAGTKGHASNHADIDANEEEPDDEEEDEED